MPIITLLTDYGTTDEYSAVLKGVIYGINPSVTIVDLTHGIAPQDVAQAARTLAAAFAYFPTGTIHVAIVDPGVGGRRAIIAADQGGQIILAPDNGLISSVWDRYPPASVVRVENQKLFLPSPSHTFHGRDVFAPVAAHLSLGIALSELGRSLDPAQALRLPWQPIRHLPGPMIEGVIEAVDHFGNLITNIDERHLETLRANNDAKMVVEVGNRRIVGLSDAYWQSYRGDLLALVNSRGRLEIAVSNGSAAQELCCGHGVPVRVSLDRPPTDRF